MKLLEIIELTKKFGGFCALSKVSFSVESGELLGLVGPNGAGKTTLFNIVTGLYKADEGKVFFKEQDITGLKFHQHGVRGIIRTFQLTRIFSSLTVQENIEIGCHLQQKGGIKRTLLGCSREERAQLEENVKGILTFTGLMNKKKMISKHLAFGEQRVLELAIALGANPILLLLDEPVAGMNPSETKRFMDLVHQIRGRETTLVIIDHDMPAIMNNCSKVIVMDHGEKIAEGKPSEIVENRTVIESYLGKGYRRA